MTRETYAAFAARTVDAYSGVRDTLMRSSNITLLRHQAALLANSTHPQDRNEAAEWIKALDGELVFVARPDFEPVAEVFPRLFDETFGDDDEGRGYGGPIVALMLAVLLAIGVAAGLSWMGWVKP